MKYPNTKRPRNKARAALLAIGGALVMLSACGLPTLPSGDGTAGTIGLLTEFAVAPLIVDYGNSRVVQIDEMEGAGWVATDVSGYPTDAVVADDGHIWIGVDPLWDSVDWTIAAFASVGQELPDPLAHSDSVDPVTAIAVDEAGSIIYAAGLVGEDHGIWARLRP